MPNTYHPSQPNRPGSRGFTLIELLVVIAIIGLLASIILASLKTAHIKANDAAILADIHTIQTAFEFYYDDTGHYPLCDTPSAGGWCSNAATPVICDDGSDSSYWDDIASYLAPKYLPRDPALIDNVCLWTYTWNNGQSYLVTFYPESGSGLLSSPGNEGPSCYYTGWYCTSVNAP